MATAKRETKATAKTTKPAASKTAAAKTAVKEEVKETAVVKEAAPAKKPAAKRAVKAAEPTAAVYVQYAGKQAAVKDLLEAAKAAFAQAHEGVEIKSIELYVKPEEAVAYYVVNGEGSDDYKIEL